jgi:hypothetical protein
MPASELNVSKLCELLKIFDPIGKQFVRLGNKHDGGYVIVDLLNRLDVALALGVGTDISFESDLSRFVSRIDFYDHTVERLPIHIPNANFYKQGISGLAQTNFSTLKEAAENFDLNAEILLKMDIESSEWSVLCKTEHTVLSRFQQIVVELHGLHRITEQEMGDEIIRALTTVNKSHRLVHLHVNNYEPVRIINGTPIPNVVEATYLRNSESSFEEFVFPRGKNLDSPNNSNSKDVSTRILF